MGRLTLAVDTLLEAELDERVLFEVTLEVPRRLGVEVVELALEDGDDVAGDVLEQLRVLERASARLCRPAGLGTVDRCGLHERP
jgi:hypothetical protein